MTLDNHNSDNSIREFALSKGAHLKYVPFSFPDLRIEYDSLDKVLDSAEKSAKTSLLFRHSQISTCSMS